MSTNLSRANLGLSSFKNINCYDCLFYLLTCLLVVGFKLAWRDVPVTEPRIFLLPLVATLQLLLGVTFTVQPDGYWNHAWGIVITKDCAGMNYFLILFCLLVFTNIRFFPDRKKWTAYGFFLAGSFLITLLANISRVLLTLTIGHSGYIPAVLTGKPHLALGAFVYFFFLIAANSGIGWLVRKHHHHCKEDVI